MLVDFVDYLCSFEEGVLVFLVSHDELLAKFEIDLDSDILLSLE